MASEAEWSGHGAAQVMVLLGGVYAALDLGVKVLQEPEWEGSAWVSPPSRCAEDWPLERGFLIDLRC